MDMKGVLNIVMIILAATLLIIPVSGAFAVTGINPDRGNNTGVVLVDLSGTDLPTDAGANLVMPPQPNITASSVIEVDSTRIIAAFDLKGETAGSRMVVILNHTDGSEAILEGKTFEVENLPPSITDLDPDSGVNNQTGLVLTLSGSNFLPGAGVNLTNGSFIIPATITALSDTEITCSVDLTDAASGLWSVEVNNTDGKTFLLTDSFTVMNPAPVVLSITPSTGSNNAIIGVIDLAGTGFCRKLLFR
jgi:hypothetical protein